MARTRGAAKREAGAGALGRREELTEPDADSTLCHWACPPPARRGRRERSLTAGAGAQWIDMPENALYKVFELLLQDKQDPKVVSGN